MIPALAQVPDAVGLLTQPVQEAASRPESAWSWMMPLVGGVVVVGVGLVCAGAWFAWSRRQASRDQRDVATHALAKRAGLSAPELQAIQDLVACVQGTRVAGGECATTLGLIMSPYAAAELARSVPTSGADGFDRKQLKRALEKLGAGIAMEIKPNAAKAKGTVNAERARVAKDAKGATPRATLTQGEEAIAARARAVLAAIDRAREQGYFDADRVERAKAGGGKALNVAKAKQKSA